MALLALSTQEEMFEYLQGLEATGKGTTWTMPKGARDGDDIVFYVIRTLMAFVATAQVAGSKPEMNKDPNWPGYYAATIRDIRILSRPVSRTEMLERVPGWRWPRMPQRNTIVPSDIEEQVCDRRWAYDALRCW
jgi:hypothetical protein